MKIIANALTVAAIALSPMVGSNLIEPASAATRNHVKVSYEGFQTCKNPSNSYIAKVRGKLQHGGRTGKPFNFSYCFKSASACNNFVGNIKHIIYPVEEIYYARCRTR